MCAFVHAIGNIVNIVVGQAVETGRKNLGEAIDDVEGGTDLVIHILDERCLTAVGVLLELLGAGELVVMLFKFVIGQTDVANRLGQRLLHANKAVL